LTCAYGPSGSLCVASSRRLPFPREHKLTRCTGNCQRVKIRGVYHPPAPCSM